MGEWVGLQADFTREWEAPQEIAPARFAARQGFVVARSAKLVGIDYAETFDSGGVERSASDSPVRTPPHQTVRADFPHTASRVKLVSSVSPSCEGYQPEFL